MQDRIVMTSRCRGWLLAVGAVVVLGAVLPACSSDDPNAVAGFKGYSLDAATLRSEFERVNSGTPWETTTVEQRAAFAELLLKKEMLLEIAREACPEPDRKAGRLNRVLYEKTLLAEFLDARRERFSLPKEQVEAEAAKLTRQARVHLATVRQADVDSIRAEMLAGGDFDEVARKYATELGPQGRGYAETTIGLDNMPRPVLRAVFLDDVPPGTVVGPVSSTKGNYFLRVIEYTPWDLTQIPGAMDRAYSVVNDVHYQPFNQAYMDSLTAASGIKLHPDSYPLVQEIMQTFWDSVNVARASGETIAFQEFLAPVWLVPADKADVPVMELFGKTYGLREFIKSLDDVDLDSWITVGPMPKVTFQVETRANRLLSILQAEKTGVPDREGFRGKMDRLREQHLLDQFRERYLPTQYDPDDATLQALYQEQPERYMTDDAMAYGILMYPRDREARAREVRETLRNSDPVRWFELAAAEADANSEVHYYADTGLQNAQAAPPDPSWEPFRSAALGLEPGQLSEVLRTQHGFTIVRCNQRQHPRRMTFEEAREMLLTDARTIWVEEQIEKRLGDAMVTRGAKVDTVRLEALKMAEASGTNR